MIRVSVDDRISECNSDRNLGEVVNKVLSDLPPNRIVTHIELDGCPIPRYRDANALRTSLQQVKELQIRTADSAIWAANGLDNSLGILSQLRQSLLKAAELFRENSRAEANRFFFHCIEGLERFLDTIVLTKTALRIDFDKVAVEGISMTRIEQEFLEILTSIVCCQEQDDFEGVADRVEYELLTNFHLWERALRQLRISSHSNA